MGFERLIFDGPLGLVTARIMARKNADTEREAIETLAPTPEDSVLAIGFGPGAGVAELAPRVASVGGVDPSAAMVRIARRHARTGQVRLERGTADRIPWPDDSFDGAIAVNSIMLWRPLDASITEVARVLRPGARLVTFTHDWALARGKGVTVDSWLADTTTALAAGGFSEVRNWRGKSEEGRSVALSARAT
jgi:ubiquinone/menaquinone biosynthesis C-methylase UbiE